MNKLPALSILGIILLSFSTEKTPGVYKDLDVKYIEKSMVLLPQGTLYCASGNKADSGAVQIDLFYISKYEVSNREYLAFINDLRLQDSGLYKRMLPDTLVWRKEVFKGPYANNYFRNSQFADYPVVGLSHEQAEEFCRWLTKKYMHSTKRKFKSASFMLPQKSQWVYAAGGYRSVFPSGYHLQNSTGQWLANFRVFPQGSIRRSELYAQTPVDTFQKVTYYIAGNNFVQNPSQIIPDSLQLLTTPVNSGFADKRGLYNMAGNVEEYVREKGLCKGGSWLDPGYYLQNSVDEIYDSGDAVSVTRGFRYVMEIAK